MRTLSWALLLLPLSNPVLAKKAVKMSPPRNVLMIGIDGLTGNQLDQAAFKLKKAPNIRSLMERGKATRCLGDRDKQCARAHDGFRYGFRYSWVTAPGWGAVLSGVNTDKHLIRGNDHKEQNPFSITSKRYPTFLKIAKDRGHKTAALGVANFLTTFTRDGGFNNGILDYECGSLAYTPNVKANASSSCNVNYRMPSHSKRERDKKMARQVGNLIKADLANVIMVVFDEVDSAGHDHGFSSNREYLAAIQKADALVGQLISLVKKTKKDFLVVLTSDHGGHNDFFGSGGSHGRVTHQDEVIPFVVATFGPRAEPLRELTYPVTQMDVKPTILKWLDIPGYDTDGVAQGI